MTTPWKENHAPGFGHARHVSSRDELRRRLRRTYWLLIEVSQLAASSRDEELYERVCRLLVDRGEYLHTWIGVRGPGDDVIVIASAGRLAVNDIAPMLLSVDLPHDHGLRGPPGSAPPLVCNDLAEVHAPSPWRRRLFDDGVRSFALVPFSDDASAPLLAILSGTPGVFDEEMVVILSQMARLVSRTRDGVAVPPLSVTAPEVHDLWWPATGSSTTESSGVLEEKRFRVAFERSTSAMVFTDLDNLTIDVNAAFCHLTGYERHELLGRGSALYTHPDDVGISESSFEELRDGAPEVHYVKRYRRKDGSVCVVDVSRAPVLDDRGRASCYISFERDITEERTLADRLTHQVLYDQLTGLANRHLFAHRLESARAHVASLGGYGAVLLVDLDDFRGVNDSFGHETGDDLLIAVARRLEAVTRPNDLLCHFGGDQFLYLAEGLRNIDDAEDIARRLLGEFVVPFSVQRRILHQRASIGIVTWDDSEADRNEILQDAHAAAYEAKRQGKNRSVLFTGNMHADAVHRYSLTQELRQALDMGELTMHYQPIVDLATTRVVGFEALIRWPHETRGWIPPLDFVPLAEQSDLIFHLGEFALREAVRTAAQWSTPDGAPAPYVTVNFSALQFHDRDLTTIIESALADAGLPAHRLKIEITESVAFRDIDRTLEVIRDLENIGITFALDDFGTGYSTLSHLAMMRPSVIKIDQHFVRPPVPSAENDVLLEAIVRLGQRLDIAVLAEGIEETGQLGRLRDLSCDLGQGYLFSRAVPAEDTHRMLYSEWVQDLSVS